MNGQSAFGLEAHASRVAFEREAHQLVDQVGIRQS